MHAVETGALGRDDVTQLGDVLAGTAAGRQSDEDITVFDSTGLAIQDLAIALSAMEHADELDLPKIDLQSDHQHQPRGAWRTRRLEMAARGQFYGKPT